MKAKNVRSFIVLLRKNLRLLGQI